MIILLLVVLDHHDEIAVKGCPLVPGGLPGIPDLRLRIPGFVGDESMFSVLSSNFILTPFYS